MRARTLAVLAAAAVAAMAVALLVSRTPGVDAPGTGALLLPGLEERLNDVSAVRIGTGGETPAVTLERDEESWRVAQAHGYPADTGMIRRLLVGLARAAVVEPKTANPEYYPRLGLAEPGSDEGAGTRLSLAGVEVPAVVVGRRETATRKGTYVRVEGREGSYLVDAELDPAADPNHWLDRDLLDVPAEAIQSIEVTHADGGRLAVTRGDEGLALAELPEGREPAGPAAAQAMSRALSGLRFDEVRPAADLDAGEPAATAVYRLEEDHVVTVRGWSVDDARWIALETGDKRHEGWVYRIPTWKYDLIVRRAEDLTRPAAGEAGG